MIRALVLALMLGGCTSDAARDAAETLADAPGEIDVAPDIAGDGVPSDAPVDAPGDIDAPGELDAPDTANLDVDPDVPAVTGLMRLHFLDVGQGDAAIVELPCGAMLIDTGGELTPEAGFDSDVALEEAVRDFFAARPDLGNTFDLVVLTHPHIDHTRGAPRLVEMAEAGELVIKNVVTNGAEGSGLGTAQQRALHDYADAHPDIGRWYVLQRKTEATGLINEVIDPFGECDGIDPKVTALWGRVDDESPLSQAWSADALSNDNNHSVVLRIDFGAASALFSGDLEVDGIRAIIEQYRDTGLLDVDVCKVGHHGSYNGTTAAYVGAMTPAAAVISAGPAARRGSYTAYDHGHPRIQAVSDLIGDLDSVGVSLEREPIEALVAVDYDNGHGVFETRRIERAVYSTGWEGGTVVVGLHADGTVELP